MAERCYDASCEPDVIVLSLYSAITSFCDNSADIPTALRIFSLSWDVRHLQFSWFVVHQI